MIPSEHTEQKLKLPCRPSRMELESFLRNVAPNILFTHSGYEQVITILSYAEGIFDAVHDLYDQCDKPGGFDERTPFFSKQYAIDFQNDFFSKLEQISDTVYYRKNDHDFSYLPTNWSSGEFSEERYEAQGNPIPKHKALLHWDSSRFSFGILWYRAVRHDKISTADGEYVDDIRRTSVLKEASDIHPGFYPLNERRSLMKFSREDGRDSAPKEKREWQAKESLSIVCYEYLFHMNGGLIYHGPGSGETFSVCVDAPRFWSIHT